MSVKLMAMTYEAHFWDITYQRVIKKKSGEAKEVQVKILAQTSKSVTLALADHANEEGEGAYPGLSTLESKTELSRNSVIATLKALKEEGVILYVGLSRYGTNNYTISKPKLAEMAARPRQERKKVVKPLPKASEVASLPLVKPLPQSSEATAPEPYINRPSKTSIKEGASASFKAKDFPGVVLVRSVTGRYPARDTFEIVDSAVQKVKVRLGRDVVCEDLRPYWEAWRTNGFKSINLSWLTDWAVSGIITKNGAKHATTPNRQPNAAIDPGQLERDRATAERIKANRAAQQAARV